MWGLASDLRQAWGRMLPLNPLAPLPVTGNHNSKSPNPQLSPQKKTKLRTLLLQGPRGLEATSLPRGPGIFPAPIPESKGRPSDSSSPQVPLSPSPHTHPSRLSVCQLASPQLPLPGCLSLESASCLLPLSSKSTPHSQHQSSSLLKPTFFPTSQTYLSPGISTL